MTATEPEETMANQIREKAKLSPNPLKVFTKTMQQLGEFIDHLMVFIVLETR